MNLGSSPSQSGGASRWVHTQPKGGSLINLSSENNSLTNAELKTRLEAAEARSAKLESENALLLKELQLAQATLMDEVINGAVFDLEGIDISPSRQRPGNQHAESPGRAISPLRSHSPNRVKKSPPISPRPSPRGGGNTVPLSHTPPLSVSPRLERISRDEQVPREKYEYVKAKYFKVKDDNQKLRHHLGKLARYVKQHQMHHRFNNTTQQQQHQQQNPNSAAPVLESRSISPNRRVVSNQFGSPPPPPSNRTSATAAAFDRQKFSN